MTAICPHGLLSAPLCKSLCRRRLNSDPLTAYQK